jgi:hypothetical protein
VIARWRPEQFVEVSARDIARSNPWAGIPAASISTRARPTRTTSAAFAASTIACASVRDSAASPTTARRSGAASRRRADTGLAVDDERWKVPPSLGTLLQPLETLHRRAARSIASTRPTRR